MRLKWRKHFVVPLSNIFSLLWQNVVNVWDESINPAETKHYVTRPTIFRGSDDSTCVGLIDASASRNHWAERKSFPGDFAARWVYEEETE